MENRLAYTERFIMHTELYMLLTGKNSHELSLDDMERIGLYLELDENRDRYFQRTTPRPDRGQANVCL